MVTGFPYYPAWRKVVGDEATIYRQEDFDAVTLHRCWLYVPQKPRALKRIFHEASFVLSSFLRLLFLPKPDVYVVISPPLLLGAAAWLLTRFKRAPFVFYVQDLQPDGALSLGMLKQSRLTQLLYRLEAFAYAKAARVAGISQGMLSAFAEKKVDAGKVTYFPNGVVLPGKDQIPARGRFRERCGFTDDDFLVIYSGNLGVKQGLDTVIEAARHSTNRLVRFVICGDGAERSHLSQRLSELGLSNLLMLPLQQEQHYFEMLVDADVSLITQQHGSGGFCFPSKLLTTTAFSCPVIAVADESSELTRAVREHGLGVTVEPDQPRELARVLNEIAATPERLEAFGETARRFASQYDRGRVLAEFEERLLETAQTFNSETEPSLAGQWARLRHRLAEISCSVSDGWNQVTRLGTLLGIGALGIGWLLLFNELRVDWSTNAQYAYGWLVPILGAGLFWRRWKVRPPSAPEGQAGLLAVGLALLLGLLLPIRLVEEANPEWRLVFWVHTLQMVLLTLGGILHSGGWRLARHCAFPICFVFIAVPWPKPIENHIMQTLMPGIAAVTAEALMILDISAVQQGNLIEVGGGLVGVDEACSGVRSLQTTLLVAFCFGELYRLSVSRRLCLLLLGWGVALLANFGRTLFLVWAAACRGMEWMNGWHDAAGVTAVAVLLPALWFLTQWLQERHSKKVILAT